MSARRSPWLLVLAAVLACLALSAPAASADDRIYWGNQLDDAIALASLDGSGVASLTVGSASVNGPTGTVIDTPTRRIFWANGSSETIAFANLDGSGGGELPVGGATLERPWGLAIDPVARRVYWTNFNGDSVSFAKLDGSGGGDLPIPAALVRTPTAVALDPVGGRLYWTNYGDASIASAALDGSGATRLPIPPTAFGGPSGIAVDPAGGRVYWANFDGDSIGYATLDGSSYGTVDTGSAIVAGPRGIAFDPAQQTLYWANTAVTTVIASARVGGAPDGRNLVTLATSGSAAFPALLQAPQSVAAPLVTGRSARGGSLSCSPGSWVADYLGSFVYRAPQALYYQWVRDGVDVAGATSATVVADKAGEYVCRVRAENFAGSASASSAAYRVTDAFGARTNVTLALARARVPARGPLKVRVVNRNAFAVGAVLFATVAKVRGVRVRVRLGPVRGEVAAQQSRTVALKLPAKVRRLLAQRGSLRLVLKAVVTDPSGTRRTVTRKVTVKLARR